jgi:lipooligosaccharide transport system permease protein
MSVSVRHAAAVWRRNAAMYARTWKWNILPNFFEPVFYLAAVGIGVGSYIQEMGGVSYAQFLAPGLVCVAAMNGASYEVTYNVFVRMNFEKAYDAMLTTPLDAEDVVTGEVLWALTRALIYGGCFYVILILFGLAPLPGSLLAVPAILLSGLLFASLGVTFALHVQTIDVFSFYFTLFLTPLFLFSDVFFPLDERLSPFWRRVAEALPLLHPVRLARSAFSGSFTPTTALWDIAYILGVSAILLHFATAAARRRLTN